MITADKPLRTLLEATDEGTLTLENYEQDILQEGGFEGFELSNIEDFGNRVRYHAEIQVKWDDHQDDTPEDLISTYPITGRIFKENGLPSIIEYEKEKQSLRNRLFGPSVDDEITSIEPFEYDGDNVDYRINVDDEDKTKIYAPESVKADLDDLKQSGHYVHFQGDRNTGSGIIAVEGEILADGESMYKVDQQSFLNPGSGLVIIPKINPLY